MPNRVTSKERQWRLEHLYDIVPPNDLATLIDLVESNVIPRAIGKEILANWFWHGLNKLTQGNLS